MSKQIVKRRVSGLLAAGPAPRVRGVAVRGAPDTRGRPRGYRSAYVSLYTRRVTAAFVLLLMWGVPADGFVLDGGLADWPAEEAVVVTGDAVLVRMAGVGERSLTGGPENVALLLDLDGAAATGADLTAEGGISGIDVRVDFNAVWPTPAPGERGRRGSRVTGYAGGRAFGIHQSVVDLHSAPTHAAEDFEVRLRPQFARPLPAATADARGIVLVQDRGSGRTVARGPVLRASAIDLPDPPAAAIPEKPAGAIRVMSWNVLYEGPTVTPDPFARIIGATSPDMLLIQEWSRLPIDDALVRGWLERHVGGAWHVETSRAQGVAVASRFPILARGPDFPEATPENLDDEPARIAAALLDTPAGPLAVASAHLKCCGWLGSAEDEKRLAETAVAETIVRDLAGAGPAVVGGDFNLVGSIRPIRLDVNGLLAPARPVVLGGRTLHTWRDAAQDFGQSRLDYLLAPPGTIVQSFALDSARLAAEGVRPGDSAASDHLPIVADIVLP